MLTPLNSQSAPGASQLDRRIPEFLTIEQAAERFPGVFTPRLLRHLIQQRRIPYSKPGKQIVFDADDLVAYVRSTRREALN